MVIAVNAQMLRDPVPKLFISLKYSFIFISFSIVHNTIFYLDIDALFSFFLIIFLLKYNIYTKFAQIVDVQLDKS